MIYFCCDETRRNSVKEHPLLNGIDFLDVVDDPAGPIEKRQRTLLVHFVKDLAASPPFALSEKNIRLEGGERIRSIAIEKVTLAPDGKADVVAVKVSQPGDFSVYTLRLVADHSHAEPPPGFDPILSSIDFSFKVACPSDFDCRQTVACPPAVLTEPEINYLAKDYASFRQLMLDRMSALMPQWQERNASDLGIALVELLAYAGDYLSYRQDAVATESYLGTARRRISVRRHARLVDYHMHDGSNARAWVQVRVRSDVPKLPRGTQIFSRITDFKKTRITPPTLSPPVSSADYEQANRAHPVIFETMHDAKLFAAHNEINFYTWGDERCCLPKGATRASLNNKDDALVNLKPGDVLIFVEARNPENGNAEEADPAHRHCVRLTNIHRLTDPLYTDADGSSPLRVLDIEWSSEDALPFPLCLWMTSVGGNAKNKKPASVALGNIVLADHGETITGEGLGVVPQSNPVLDKAVAGNFCSGQKLLPAPAHFSPQLQQSPVTFAAPFDPLRPPSSAAAVMTWAVEEFLPAVKLTSELDGASDRWEPQRDLLGSHADSKEFVVEVELDGTAAVRFGDDRFGSRPASGTSFTAAYRVGNGTRGNVGANALAHIVSDEAAIIEGGVRNPLPAQGGVEPESIERARQNAPSAFRRQERAVTPADYGKAAERHRGIQ
ncbi:MAG TPA: hypothetical protein VGC64_06035, partial [Pyrinomonadaceae bacterium]